MFANDLTEAVISQVGTHQEADYRVLQFSHQLRRLAIEMGIVQHCSPSQVMRLSSIFQVNRVVVPSNALFDLPKSREPD